MRVLPQIPLRNHEHIKRKASKTVYVNPDTHQASRERIELPEDTFRHSEKRSDPKQIF